MEEITVYALKRHASTTAKTEARPRRQTLIKLLGVLARTIWVWLVRRRTRRELGTLAELNSHLLADIGLSRPDAWREAAKPFWRP